ncbi:MAG: hypothetical protein HOE14_19055 [Gemmatimonadales bacterium]|jgi:hypothetical protein|nr:hypothetical protein [Gemmatimonadales bacterium]
MARVLAVDIIAMLEAAISIHGRELEIHGSFSSEGTVELGTVYQYKDGSPSAGIYHDAVPIENEEHKALIGDFIQFRADTLFGDGMEREYAESGMGADRPPQNYSADELRHALGENWDEDYDG